MSFWPAFFDQLSKHAHVLESEKSAAPIPRETRRAWAIAQARRGSPSMRVSTLLRKEKDGSLGGYKFATIIDNRDRVIFEDDTKARRIRKHLNDIPSADEDAAAAPSRQDGRDMRTIMPTTSVEGNAARSTQGAY